jgi:alkanesulfonate monooxygenase SsuD/methylene tetrahydromethanopterin reductase-like flavin-dependent oxidoreductase (luciferase family)
MRPRVVVYVTAEELTQLRREAARRRLSLSRYMKERLTPLQNEGATSTLHDSAVPMLSEKRLAEIVRGAVIGDGRPVAEQLRTLIVMLDQFVLSAFSHLPEIPEAQKKQAQAMGGRRHRDWQHEVEDILRQLRGESAEDRHTAAGNGAHA